MTLHYRYRDGFSVRGQDPEVVAQALKELGDEGDLTPAAVVEAAKHESSPLHDAFEWDDTAAAVAFRLQQARQLIKGVMVVYDNSQPVPMHFHLRTEDGPRYERVENVVKNRDLFEAAMAELSGKLASAKAAVDQLSEVGKARLKGKKRAAVNKVREHLTAATETVAALV